MLEAMHFLTALLKFAVLCYSNVEPVHTLVSALILNIG